MDFGLGDKIAIAGGSSKGIGRAIAIDLAAEGCKVVIVARGQEAIDATVAEIRDAGGEAIGFAADMTLKADVQRVVAQTREAFGDPDIVIPNVYGPQHGKFDDADDDGFRAAYEQIVMSEVFLLREVIPAMKRKGWGRIVTVGSICIKEPHRELPLITANVTRVGAAALHKSLAEELGPHGITINTIATGSIFTDRYKDYMSGHGHLADRSTDPATMMARPDIPVGRMGLPEELAAACVFLCSARASFITGQTLLVDGGKARGLL